MTHVGNRLATKSGTAEHTKIRCASCGGAIREGAQATIEWPFTAKGFDGVAIAHTSWEDCSEALASQESWGWIDSCTFCQSPHHDVSRCPKLVTVDG